MLPHRLVLTDPVSDPDSRKPNAGIAERSCSIFQNKTSCAHCGLEKSINTADRNTGGHRALFLKSLWVDMNLCGGGNRVMKCNYVHLLLSYWRICLLLHLYTTKDISDESVQHLRCFYPPEVPVQQLKSQAVP